MIFLGSRYESAVPFWVTAPDGTVRETVMRGTVPVAPKDAKYYVWTEMDRIDRVAGEFLKDPDLWWRIMDANPEVANPLDIAVGQVIRIPSA